jgi:hypothetical protein
MRVALYAGVSTKDKGQDYENQLQDLREFVGRKAADVWTLAGEYTDRFSAKNSDRFAFGQLFEDASRRKFDMVLFWSLDRFSREGVRETLQHLQKLDSYGVQWSATGRSTCAPWGSSRRPCWRFWRRSRSRKGSVYRRDHFNPVMGSPAVSYSSRNSISVTMSRFFSTGLRPPPERRVRSVDTF